jgi:hypothetical protein
MKITKKMKQQIRAAAKASGCVPDKRVKRKEYAPAGRRMQKTIVYSFEAGSLVSIMDTAPTYEEPNVTGIIIGENARSANYFDVLAMDGKMLYIHGKRLRKAD